MNVNYPIAFAAGAISFLAPCVIPLLPAYISYVTGVSLKDLESGNGVKFRAKVLTSSLLYILGFSVVFVALGTAAAGAGAFFRSNGLLVQRIGGFLIVIFGLDLAGYLNLFFLKKANGFVLPAWTEKLGPIRSFLVGVIFASIWTPCISAILGSILALAAISQTAVHGASLLFVYSLGISLPFLIIALSLAQAPRYLKMVSKNSGKVAKVAGIVLALLGFLLLTDTYKFVNAWIFDLAYEIGYKGTGWF